MPCTTEHIEAINQTREQLHAATEAFRKSVDELTQAIGAHLKAEVAATQAAQGNEAAVSALINIAHANRAEWSGGPTNPTNLIEAHTRAAALHFLQRGLR